MAHNICRDQRHQLRAIGGDQRRRHRHRISRLEGGRCRLGSGCGLFGLTGCGGQPCHKRCRSRRHRRRGRALPRPAGQTGDHRAVVDGSGSEFTGHLVPGRSGGEHRSTAGTGVHAPGIDFRRKHPEIHCYTFSLRTTIGLTAGQDVYQPGALTRWRAAAKRPAGDICGWMAAKDMGISSKARAYRNSASGERRLTERVCHTVARHGCAQGDSARRIKVDSAQRPSRRRATVQRWAISVEPRRTVLRDRDRQGRWQALRNRLRPASSSRRRRDRAAALPAARDPGVATARADCVLSLQI